MLNTIDKYIIKKYLGTFFFSIAIIISIAIVFDISEKLDGFMEKEAPVSAILFDYYINFIPYYSNLFAPLFCFIAVIYFSSKMASNYEIIAISAAGMSFTRMLKPYFISAAIISILTFVMISYVIPPGNERIYKFEEQYYRTRAYVNRDVNIFRQIEPGVFLYMETFDNYKNIAYKFSIENYKDNALNYKLIADSAMYNSATKQWSIRNYYTRYYKDTAEYIVKGNRLDTLLNIDPQEFGTKRSRVAEFLNNPELTAFIKKQQFRGENVHPFLIEKNKRYASPFAVFILTLIGASLSTRKFRGGLGAQIGWGIALSFSYILISHIAATYASNSGLSAFVAVWIPNIIYSLIAIVLFVRTPQ